MTDGELVRQTLSGRVDAYAELARRWAAPISALCHAKTGRGTNTEDLAQETLLRGFRSLKSLEEPERFGAWLHGIATRTCLDWLKSKQRAPVPFSDLGLEQSPEEELPSRGPTVARQSGDLANLVAEVERLPEECRQVIMLFYYSEMSYRQIADLLGVSFATVNARLTKARSLLRSRLSAYSDRDR